MSAGAESRRLHADQRQAELATLRTIRRALDEGKPEEARRIALERERTLEASQAEGETA